MTPWTAVNALNKLPERYTEMGKTCCAKGLAKSLLKHRIRCEMTNLMYKIISVDVPVAVNGCGVDPKRLTNLKNVCCKSHIK